MERHLPMIILDAEYQFDRHKLVFFFEADRRIDFRCAPCPSRRAPLPRRPASRLALPRPPRPAPPPLPASS